MKLTLRIENHETLDTGGPTSITLDGKGATVGRRSGMDWVLPDPARHISGHHFDIAYRDGAYWLTDVSTNGTYLAGQRHRISETHRLTDGDRLTVGRYVIVARIGEVAPARSAAEVGPTPWPDSGAGTPWPLGPGTRDPGLARPGTGGGGRDDPWWYTASDKPSDRAGSAFGLGLPREDGEGEIAHRTPESASQSGDDGTPPEALPPLGMPGRVPGATPSGPDSTPPAGPSPLSAPRDPGPRPPRATRTEFADAPGRASPLSDHEAVLRAFCEGAGLEPGALSGTDAETLARDLGRAIRATTEDTMEMLRDRARQKLFTRGGERTMLSATGNNPMKFLPDADRAIEAMFVAPRDGFMRGPESFETAMADLRQHQLAVFAALEPALDDLLDGLAPDQVEDALAAGTLLGGSRKARAWDAYVSRWEEKARGSEAGMLSAFLKAFARVYGQVTAAGDGAQADPDAASPEDGADATDSDRG
ncbi:type VI secretion system-associated FHA domain protein TagH [Roseivivax marinus]|uniref:type VI secretion system-associated FHA domain protein TagH n=1 Tax=Roseivivax marinus TaxID=1379903 RepID=UPI001F037550|nr:type VI secretion system-associated FHA domain protein TagH [Roseivivax marinus]UMA64505.1 type VI secretion system-associated FHA domain protein TagH [Roseivivax marinus]